MSLYNKIRCIGVRKGQSSLLKVKLIVLNHLAIATFLIVCGYIYLHFQMDGHGWQLIAIDLFALMLAILILFLNSIGKYIWTFYMVSVGYPLIFIAESLQTGMQTEMEYLLFISGIGTTLLVEDGKTKWLFFGGNFVSFILLKVFYLYYPMGLLEVKMSPAFLFINGITGFLLVYLIVNNAILNSFHLQQKLIALNDTLENKVEERTKEIEEKSKQLARSNREIQRFAYISAHDLREPLRNILGFLQLIIRKLDKRDYNEIDEYVGMVKKSVDRMDTITQDVVNYTELEEKLEYNYWVDMQQLANDLIKEFQDKNKSASIYAAGLPSVKINPQLAKNLLFNLIQNGITYCEDPQPIISISCIEEGNCFQFKIEDNGVGILKENIELAFVMFKRLHNNLDIKGSGIGLAACKKIVEGYHGEIWMESELGVGTTVFFTFPKL